jgi:hypothetical protein
MIQGRARPRVPGPALDDTPRHAPVLRLQHKRGAVVFDGITPDGSRSGLRQQHRLGAGGMPGLFNLLVIAELQRLADDDHEKAPGVLPMLAQVKKRAECVVAKEFACLPVSSGHLLRAIGGLGPPDHGGCVWAQAVAGPRLVLVPIS